MHKPRLAFVSLALATALSILHCSSSESRPPITSPDESPDGALKPPPKLDAAPDIPDTTPPPNLTISPNAVDFQKVHCGTQAPMKIVTLTNSGGPPLTISFNLLNGGLAFAADLVVVGDDAGAGAPSVVVPPGGQASLRVTALKIPTNAPTTADYYTETIALHTTPPIPAGKDAPNLNIAVKETALGAILSFSPSGANFGAVPINATATSDFTIANDGNEAAEITFTSSNPVFTFTPKGPIPVAAGAKQKVTASFTAVDTSAQSGMLTGAVTSGTLCGAAPPPFSVGGSGSTGTALVTPTSLSFGNAGLVSCGSQADSQPITIKNTGNAPFNWNAQFTSGSANYTMSPTSGTVQPAGTATIQVTPNPIPAISPVTPEFYSGTLSITTNATGDSAHIVQLHETAQGAILKQSAPGTIAFGGVALNQTATQQYNITNTGNVDATVVLSKANAVFDIKNSMPIGVNAGQNQVAIVTFTPPQGSSFTDTITASATSANGAFCDVKLPNVSLTGSGTTGVSISPTSLNFGNVNCGAAAASPQRLTLTNTGGAMQFTPSFGKGAASPYTLAYSAGQSLPYQGAITPGSPYDVGQATSVNIDVIPKQIVAPATTTNNFFGDQLTISTTSAGDTPHNIQLTETAQGAYLAVTQPATNPPIYVVALPGAGLKDFYGFTIQNQGNYPIGYQLAVTATQNATPQAFSLNVTSGALAGGASTSGVLLALDNTPVPPATPNFTPPQSIGKIDVTTTAPPSGQPLILCSDPIPSVVVNVCANGVQGNQCKP